MSHHNKINTQAVNGVLVPGTDHSQDEAIALQQQIAANNQPRMVAPPDSQPLAPFAPDPLSCGEGTANLMDIDRPL